MMIGLYRIPVWGYGVGSILRGVFRWRLLVKACMFCSSSARSSGVREQGLRALLTIRTD